MKPNTHYSDEPDVPVIRQAVEVLMKISQDEREREWAAERLRAQRDAANIVAEARVAQENLRLAQENVKMARREGFDEGIEKGQWIGRIRLLQQLLQQPETSREELNRLPQQELGQLEESLKQQLAARTPSNGTPPTTTP